MLCASDLSAWNFMDEGGAVCAMGVGATWPGPGRCCIAELWSNYRFHQGAWGTLACMKAASPRRPLSYSQHENRSQIRKTSQRLLRSEEHTSELQSPCNLVCRLLLEKKNITLTRTSTHTSHIAYSNR